MARYIPAADYDVHDYDEAVARWGAAHVVTGNGDVLLVDVRAIDPTIDLEDDEEANDDS